MEEKKQPTVSAGSGLPENVAGALAYSLGPVTGVLFLLLDKKSKLVRFHAMQSLITFGGLFILDRVLRAMFFWGWSLWGILNLAELILWVVLMIKAYQGEMYKLPYIGAIAEQQAAKMS